VLRHKPSRSVQLSQHGKVIRVHPIRHDRSRELGAFANPKGRPRRTATHDRLSPTYRNRPVVRVPRLGSRHRMAADRDGLWRCPGRRTGSRETSHTGCSWHIAAGL